MKAHARRLFLLLIGLTTLVAVGCGSDDGGGQSTTGGKAAATTTAAATGTKDKVRLGLVLPDLSISAILAVKEGADRRAKELGNVEVVVSASNDPEEQVSGFEDLVGSGVDVIGFDSLDAAAISPAVEAANKAKIPVIAILSGSKSGEAVTFLGEDEKVRGQEIGKWLVNELNGKGKVGYITGNPATVAEQELRTGWGSELAKAPGIKVVRDSPRTDFDRAKALTVTTDYLTANPDLNAIYGVVDDVALGAVQAVKATGRKVLVQGANGSCEALAAIIKGDMASTSMNFLDRLGTLYVDKAVELLDGKQLEKRYNTPLFHIDTRMAKGILDGSQKAPPDLQDDVLKRLKEAQGGCG